MTTAPDSITSCSIPDCGADLATSVTAYASRKSRDPLRAVYGSREPGGFRRWQEQQAAREHLQQDARDQAEHQAEQAEAEALHDELLEEHRRRLEARQQIERDTLLADLWERAHRGVGA